MIKFNFDENKALSAILYVAKKLVDTKDKRCTPDFHKIFKILYLADLKHLADYGRPIVGDHYIAMKDGPVPSKIYDILKIVRGDSIWVDERDYNALLSVKKGHFVYPKSSPKMDEFSESNLECINESIEENKYLNFNQLKKKTHDAAYEKATKDDKISYLEMAKVAGANNSMLKYMHSLSENERIFGA
jgi:uncharacterized phage-associated protein